jgi:two-component system LytT family response regulator
MIRALIIDDEQKARNILYHYISNFIPEITEVRLADSVDSAIAQLKDYDPNIVFLDVEMPYKNGFDFLTEIKEPTFDLVFTTAYNQYAIQAIRFSALDYLLKPVDPDELKAAIQRHLEKQVSQQQTLELYKNLSQNIEKKDVKDFTLAVPSSEGTYFFKIDDIIRLEADRTYTIIHLVNKKPFLASKNLKHFEEMLEDSNFIRTHKSHLVNVNFISKISNDKETIELKDGTKVEVSRRKKEEVMKKL